MEEEQATKEEQTVQQEIEDLDNEQEEGEPVVETDEQEKDGDGIKFRKYNEITNFESKNNFMKFVDEGLISPDIEWYMSEKVHGANFSISTTDGVNLVPAKRTSLLKESDSFFNYLVMLELIKPTVKTAYDIIKKTYNDVTLVTFYGELFGGLYPHPQVKAVPKVSHVQKGVYYCPDLKFYVFDIWVKGRSFLDYADFEGVCEGAGFIYAKALKFGRFKELIEFDIENFTTTLPQQFGLPPLAKNIAEGIILKPIKNQYLAKGTRAIVKFKSMNFKEVSGVLKSKQPRQKPQVPEKPGLPPHMVEYEENLKRYVTANRLRNVLSKFGDVSKNDKSQILSLLTKDVLKDFYADFPEFQTHKKDDQKKVTSKLGHMVIKLLNSNWEDIISKVF
eukprot:TRINITY_DN5741_c0_g1_i1.p1 TRINITY_DN5741_c0_g1~~TRINITY_DN5741_c0_g1_i1.p1  ORF type:complete len:398 (-),score=89.71 TRINITY_DN5741_c0_g1_i1:121-1293(-)